MATNATTGLPTGLPTTSGLGLGQGDNALPTVVTQPDSSADGLYRKKATEAAVKFESFFIGHMLKQMRSSARELASDDSASKDSINSDMLDMADTLVADQLAGQRAFGIADMILRQLLPAAPAAAHTDSRPAGADNKVIATKSSRQT